MTTFAFQSGVPSERIRCGISAPGFTPVRSLKLWPAISWVSDTESDEVVVTIGLNRLAPSK